MQRSPIVAMQERQETPTGGSTAHARAVNLRPQPWRWNHPRVLVEHPDEAAGLAIASGLRFAGYAVDVCPGPQGRGQCPLIGPEGCAPAHDADLVVCCLGYEREAAREVLRELRTRCPHVPLVVETPSDIDADLRELLDGCHQLPAPASAEQIVAAVQSLLGQATEESPSGA
jgi:CheY-like chemotaxis protein